MFGGAFALPCTLYNMILDLLIAIFFLFVGIEITATLTHPKQVLLPAIAALGGMVIPASIFLILNPGSQAWATAMPTDLALALGVFALLGKSANPAVRIFLLTLAVADDLFSLIVLAILYGDQLDMAHSASTLGAAALGASLAIIPKFPVKQVVAILSPLCTFFVIPVYVIAKLSQGISMDSITSETAISLTIARVIGKILGITLFAWLAITLNIVRLPSALKLSEIAGVGALAGMGLTVALVISEVAVESKEIQGDVKTGLIISALISGMVGYIWLKKPLAL
ncbi:Na+/H+ antiporter NhaA [Candidatus Planktophila lacus]|nr:Na+/H+ antiporter NhaA [Candidatus Planktophila lacus]